MTFTLTITLSQPAMTTPRDIAVALLSVAEKLNGDRTQITELNSYDKQGRIQDEDGNTVGVWVIGR